MGWITDGPWITRNGIDWTAEMSELSHNSKGHFSLNFLPDLDLRIRDLRWERVVDSNHDVSFWEASTENQNFTIFND